MATLTHLTDNVSTSNSTTTASISPVAGRHYLTTVTMALSAGNVPTTDLAVSGCNLTWTLLGSAVYGQGSAGRRRVYLFIGSGASPSSGVLTIDYTGTNAGTFQEHMWSVEEVQGLNSSTPTDGVVTGQSADSTSPLTLTISATPAAGDVTFGAFAGAESAGLTEEGSYTVLVDRSGGANTRSVLTQYRLAANDVTPTTSWTSTGSGGAGGVALLLKDSGAGGTTFNKAGFAAMGP
jgi:hypothetical protein